MTASEFARLLRAKKNGEDKWIALCPAHPDRHPSLTIVPGQRGVLIRCRSNNCSTKEILGAMGLRFTDLFYDKCASPAVRARVSLQRTRDDLEHELDLVVALQSWEPEKRNYWAAAERKIREKILMLRCRIEPVAVIREWRGRVWRSWTQRKRDGYLDQVGRELFGDEPISDIGLWYRASEKGE